jgi:hypothetical protein
MLEANSTSDKLIWPYSLNGDYQVKKAYEILTHTEQQPPYPHQSRIWKKLWKIKLPQKILSVAWKILHHAIPVKFELNRRGIHCDVACNLCTNDSNETMDHIFLQCEFARAVWFGADINIRAITEAGIPFHKWIHDLLLHHKELPNNTPHYT